MVAGIDGLLHEAAPVLAPSHSILVVELRRRTPHHSTLCLETYKQCQQREKYPKRQLRRWWWRVFLSSRERELLYSLSGLLMSHSPRHFSFFRQTPDNHLVRNWHVSVAHDFCAHCVPHSLTKNSDEMYPHPFMVVLPRGCRARGRP